MREHLHVQEDKIEEAQRSTLELKNELKEEGQQRKG